MAKKKEEMVDTVYGPKPKSQFAEGPGLSIKDMNESLKPWIKEVERHYRTPTPGPKKGRVK